MPRSRRFLLLSCTLIVHWPAVARAQETLPRPGDSNKTIPERIAPPEGATGQDKRPDRGAGGAGQGESLSDKLGRTEGVIKPPDNVDREMSVPAPVPDPGTMPVIPPPGSPGNPSPVRPK